MRATRDDVFREAQALRELARQLVARLDDLVTMAAALPDTGEPSETWLCPVSDCRLPLHGRSIGDHLRNVHSDAEYDAWVVEHPDHVVDLAVELAAP